MKRAWAAVAALVALLTLGALLSTGGAPGPTVRNRGGDGLRAAFRYLEERDWPVSAWERPLSELPLEPGVLVLSMPSAVPFGSTDTDALRRWLLVGGSVVVLTGGRQPGLADLSLQEALDFSVKRHLPDLPSGLSGLPEWASLTVEATPEPGADWPLSPLRLARPWWRVQAELRDEVLYRDPQGEPLVRLRQQHRGTVLLLDTGDPWTNGRITEAGNLAFIETALDRLDGDRGVIFDEWHHGWRASTEAERDRSVVLPFDLFASHLVVVYLAGLWAMGRRFGPPVRDLPIPQGSVDRDLRVLAALHRKSGHAAQAGALLLRSVRQTSRHRAAIDAALPGEFSGGPADLVRLAREVGALQKKHLL